MRKVFELCWMTAVVLSAPIGCGPSGVPSISTSLEETSVKGTVRVRGKLVDNGWVESNVANIGRTNVSARRAAINKDGTYLLKTLVGQNSIHVSCKELLTAKNRMFNENQFHLQATADENTFDIEIPSGGVSLHEVPPAKSKRRTR